MSLSPPIEWCQFSSLFESLGIILVVFLCPPWTVRYVLSYALPLPALWYQVTTFMSTRPAYHKDLLSEGSALYDFQWEGTKFELDKNAIQPNPLCKAIAHIAASIFF